MEASSTLNENGLAVHTFPLVRPRTLDGVRYDRISMTEPCVKDRMKIKDDDYPSIQEVEIAMVALLCNVPEKLVEMLSLADYMKVQEVLQNFPYPEDETCGATSSVSPA